MLNGKVAIVTGGTRGIGYAIVKKFLDNGASVVLCGSRQETAEMAVTKLKEENSGYNVEGISPKLTSYDEVKEAFARVENKYGKIDILVNNAGSSGSTTNFYDYTVEEFKQIMDLNVNNVFYCSQVAARFMKEQGGGVILFTSSMVTRYGTEGSTIAYPASKFAVNGMVLSLARGLAKDNIRVNAVAPGVTNTDMVAKLPEQMKQNISAQIPLGRIGNPEEMADAFLYLASDMSSFVTGEIIHVNGAGRS